MTEKQTMAWARGQNLPVWCRGYGRIHKVAKLNADSVEIAGHTLPRSKLERKGLEIWVSDGDDMSARIHVIQAGETEVTEANW